MNDQQLRNILTHRTIGSERLQRNAAILLPLVTVDGRDALLFEVRSKRLEMQPGEICFPGGRIESGETPERAALRELWEELRIPSWGPWIKWFTSPALCTLKWDGWRRRP